MNYRLIIGILWGGLVGSQMCAQNDTLTSNAELNRIVTVERDYQPNIEQAEKLYLPPAILRYEAELQPVVWSTYSAPLSVDYTMRTLPAAKLTFSHPKENSNFLQGGIGHRNSDLQVAYQIHNKKGNSLRLFANHDGLWGKQTLSNTQIGLGATMGLGDSQFYFQADGQHQFYSRYARYWDGNTGLTVRKLSDMKASDWQNLWTTNALFGIRSHKQENLFYRVQVGYTAFMIPTLLTEHQVRSFVDLGWKNEQHSAGVHMAAYSYLNARGDSLQILSSEYNNKHAVRVEPFYDFRTERWHLHVGMNIDLNIGKGKFLSPNDNLSFAPSPNVHFDWTTPNGKFNTYVDAIGSFGTGSVQAWLNKNRYFALTPEDLSGLTSKHVSGYTPVDATLGVRWKAIPTLLLDVHAGYGIYRNQYVMTPASLSLRQQDAHNNMNYLYTDYQQIKAGLSLHYHWRDIIFLNADAHYYYAICDTIEQSDLGKLGKQVYDRPSWDANIRLDWKIDRKWSIYLDNHFTDSRKALVVDENGLYSQQSLRPTLTLNAGIQYAFNRWLTGYLQLNNYLNRHEDIWYGYQTQGFHFLLGVNWKF